MEPDKPPVRLLQNQSKPFEWVDDVLDAISEMTYNRYTIVGPHWLLWLGLIFLILDLLTFLYPDRIKLVSFPNRLVMVGASAGLVLIGGLFYWLRARWRGRPAYRERVE